MSCAASEMRLFTLRSGSSPAGKRREGMGVKHLDSDQSSSPHKRHVRDIAEQWRKQEQERWAKPLKRPECLMKRNDK